jgi:catechol 2,3-dioxygenase-like lactoylglutathione lyase family enzyme
MNMKADERVALLAAPRISHILETSLYVDDLDRSKEFYERVLAFELIFQDERMCALRVPGSGVLLLFLKNGSLSPHPTPGGIIPPHGGDGALHLCFAIPLATLDSWIGRFATLGIAIESRVKQYYGGTSLYFRDPDGHSLEVATPGLWPNF